MTCSADICFRAVETAAALSALAASAVLAVAGRRHEEWSGGFFFASALLQAAAAAELSCELPGQACAALAALAAVQGAVAVAAFHGSLCPGLKAIVRNRRFVLLAAGAVFSAFFLFGGGSRAACAPAALAPACWFAWAALFWKDKSRVFPLRTSPLNRLVEAGPLEEIGRGTRRVAYKVGDTGYCVKFYYPQEQCIEALKMQKSIQRDVRWRRFNKLRNASCEEVYVYNRFRHSMPEEIRARMPPVCERVFHPVWGWGVIETYYTNPDGTAILPYENEMKRQRDPETKREIYRQARDFLLVLIRHAALFHEPGNLHVLKHGDGSIELKLIDFEPESKTAIPLEMFWPWFRRRKLARKATRYLAHIRRAYGVDVSVETEIG